MLKDTSCSSALLDPYEAMLALREDENDRGKCVPWYLSKFRKRKRFNKNRCNPTYSKDANKDDMSK